jgi:hypothetical protein
MLLLLLILPLGGFEILVVPAALWTLGPASWHLPLAIVMLLVVAAASTALLQKYRTGSAERRGNLAEQAGWRWPPGMPAEQYRLRLATFLLLHGWRMNGSAVTETGRVRVAARKERCVLAMLCVGPDRDAAGDADAAALAAFRKEIGATHAVLVTTAPRPNAAMTATTMDIRFEDLAALDLTLGLQTGFLA